MSDLVISHVTKIYQGKGAGRIRALDNVSLSAACGKITAFLGLNGAGKTTLIKIVAGLVLADERYQSQRTATAMLRRSEQNRRPSQQQLSRLQKRHAPEPSASTEGHRHSPTT